MEVVVVVVVEVVVPELGSCPDSEVVVVVVELVEVVQKPVPHLGWPPFAALVGSPLQQAVSSMPQVIPQVEPVPSVLQFTTL